MFKNNPEFKKNLKLEFSWVKLLVPVFVLALTAWLGWSSGEENTWRNTPLIYQQSESLTYWMFGFGFIFAIVWGSYLVSNSFFGEIRQKTWDFVRMSPLSPAKILTGKLFGAPSAVWVITLLGILPIILLASMNLFLNGGYHRPMFDTLISLTIAILSWIILSYSFVLLSGLYTSSKDSRHNTVGVVLLALVGGLFIGGMISNFYQEEFRISKIYDCPPTATTSNPTSCTNQKPDFSYNGIEYQRSNIQTDDWYGLKNFPLTTLAMILSFFAFWSVIGAYRNIQKAVQYKISPFIWPIFIVTTIIFLNGFWQVTSSDPLQYNRDLSGYLALGSLLFLIFTLPVCIKESRNTIQYRQWFEYLRSKNYKDMFRLTPLWVLSVLCFAVLIPIISMINSIPSSFFFPFYISLILFAVRDIMAIHIISWRKSVRMPMVGISIYFLVIYLLMPFVASILVGEKSGSFYFLPLIPFRDYSYSQTPDLPNMLGFVILHGLIIIALSIPFLKGLKNLLKP